MPVDLQGATGRLVASIGVTIPGGIIGGFSNGFSNGFQQITVPTLVIPGIQPGDDSGRLVIFSSDMTTQRLTRNG